MDVNLLLRRKDGSFKSIAMPSSVTIIGRRKDCDLRIPLAAVSRRHCRLFTQEDTLKIRDLNSRNGTIINGQTVEETDVKPGDKLTVGPLTFILQVDGKPDKLEAADAEALGMEDTDLEIPDGDIFADADDLKLDDEQS